MFVDDPVGTGKSGMLVPSAQYAKKEKKKRIVYATATINLQNQVSKRLVRIHSSKR